MECQLQAMEKSFKSKKHIAALFPDEPLIVRIGTLQSSWLLKVSRNEFAYCPDESGERFHAVLVSSLEEWLPVLEGRIKLREAIACHSIHYKGTYRLSLLLESFFWLARDSTLQSADGKKYN